MNVKYQLRQGDAPRKRREEEHAHGEKREGCVDEDYRDEVNISALLYVSQCAPTCLCVLIFIKTIHRLSLVAWCSEATRAWHAAYYAFCLHSEAAGRMTALVTINRRGNNGISPDFFSSALIPTEFLVEKEGADRSERHACDLVLEGILVSHPL